MNRSVKLAAEAIITKAITEWLRRGFIRIAAKKKTDFQRLVREMAPDYRRLLNGFLTRDQLTVNMRLVNEMVNGGSVEALTYQPVSLVDVAVPRHALKFYQELKLWLADAVNKSGSNFIGIMNKRLRLNQTSEMIFDITSRRVANWIDTQALDLAVRLADSRTRVLRDTLQFVSTRTLQGQMTFAEATATMKSNMVITPWQSEQVKKVYLRALEAGKPKSEALMLAKESSENWKRIRAKTQLMTELKQADEFGKREAVQQAIDRGIIQDEVRRLWVKTGFNDNWPSTNINDGTTAGMEEVFPSGDPWPDEINERCEIQYLVLKEAA